MINTYWDKYINEELSEKESEEFYLLLKKDKNAQTELLELIQDEALFGQTSDELLSNLNTPDEGLYPSTPLPMKKSSAPLYTILSLVALFIIAMTIYLVFIGHSNINKNDINQIADKPDQEPTQKDSEVVKLDDVPQKNLQVDKVQEKLSIEQMNLPVTLATVQYPSGKTRNPFYSGTDILLNHGPVFSHLSLTKAQTSKLRTVYYNNSKQIMGSYMKHYMKINACPLTCIYQKKHINKNELEKEMFVWAKAHVAMSDTIQTQILKILNKEQKTKYLDLFKIINKYSDENSHLYKSGSNKKLNENTLEYLQQLQPLLK